MDGSFDVRSEIVILQGTHNLVRRRRHDSPRVSVPPTSLGQAQRDRERRACLDRYSWLFVGLSPCPVDFEEVVKKKGPLFTSMTFEQISK